MTHDLAGERAGGSSVRRALLVLLGLAVLLLLAWAALWAAAGSGVAKGTTVLGVPIGGQSRSQAERTLTRELGGRATASMPVRAGTEQVSLDPKSSGLSLDVAATVAAAEARSWNPVRLVRSLTGSGTSLVPVVAVDQPALRAAVERLAASVDRVASEGSITFDETGTPVQVAPVAGRTLERGKSVDALASAYLRSARPVQLPVAIAAPAVSAAEVARVAAEVAVPATAAAATLDVEGTDVPVAPAAIAKALTFVPMGDSLTPVLDGETLHQALAEPLAKIEQPAADATFRIRGGKPVVVPAKQGRAISPTTLSAAVLPVLAGTDPASRRAVVPLEASEPAVTTAMAQGLGVTQLVSTFTTYYPSDFPPRLQNIHRGADLLDDTMVLPDTVFSLNQTVGERTAARGFAAGFIINGGRLEVDFGGGVSQLVTTTFNTAYFAGLQIVEHHPHSFYISRYPEGREATVAWGSKDLRVRNDSPHGIFITTSYTNSSVTVSMYGTKRYRIESVKGPRYDFTPFRTVYDPRPAGTSQGSCVATSGVSGFKVVVTRLFYQGGSKMKSEQFRTTYNPENQIVCDSTGPDPSPSPKPSPSPSTKPPGSPSPTPTAGPAQ